jgi:hypothetical protein
MTPFTADELGLLIKVRDLLEHKRDGSKNNASCYRLDVAQHALRDVLRFSYLDTGDGS